ncbi:pectate lyase-like adhesive domain-containing protein [Lactobacillus helveticus]|uniref:pectate lyase-like adhesive domain-containing protein n=1 Tax=Lactobacillus helveticus TaxID=1587 RepID=UPI000AAE7CB3|nr:pectate lyase-like adhesive domain-containing protein [Lactobacillus helveticus]MDY0874849.1 pectate lyase-like adhesive domain-containing protein [Lactobacillus helveticus]NRO47659.1 hypothetical protein [Lactobacillus helveticus]NRO73425.1 hypothetical protein [Lactobacillus helveticus]NRO81701.1 hypothetical protein [Lactobacillus helveticus]
MNSIGDQQVQAADNNPAVKPDDAKVAQSESGTKDTTEVTKNDGSVESLEENPDVKKVAATIKPIKKTEETSSTGNENNVEANKSVDQNANSVNKTSEQVAAPNQEEKKATQKPVTSQNQAQSESIQNKKNNTKTDQTGKTKETKTVKLPDTPKTLSLADFTKETKELETKLPNMSEAERKAVADKLLADQKTLSAADQAKLATMISEQADISNGQTEHAHDYSSFLSALRNANASTIVLDNDIDFSNANLKHGLLNLQGGNWERLNNKGIARTVTIQGSKKADGTITELKFGDRYIAFTDDNQSNGQGWHIKLSDLTLQTENVYGPLYFALVGVTNAGQDYVEYHNVTTTTDTKRVFNSDAANVQFSGANVLNSSPENGGAAIYANSVEALDGNTIVNALPDAKTTAGSDGNAAILISAYKSHGNVVIDESANLTVNTDGHYGKQSDNTYDPNRNHDMLGIRYQGAGAQGKSIDEATGGVVRVKKNGSLTINTGTGGSTAIEAGHLDVQDGANVTINSKHDTHLGHAGDHWGPIMLGYADGDNNAEARIGKGANLTIKRISSEAYASMISFGSGMANNGKTFRVEVNGGTLDLQDSAKDVATWQKSWVTNAPRAGMITMWDMVVTTLSSNPEYINLQRKNANQAGSMFRMEGSQNHFYINDPSADYYQKDGNTAATVPVFIITMKMPIIRVDADHPNELVDPSAYSRQINFVVKYDGAGELTPKDNVQTIDFKRTVTASPITGKIIEDGKYTTPWQSDQESFSDVVVPVVPGYHADKKMINGIKSIDSIEKTVNYAPNGRIIPVDPDNKELKDVKQPIYKTSATDATQVESGILLPKVKGYNCNYYARRSRQGYQGNL